MEEETNKLRKTKSLLEKEQLRISNENDRLKMQNSELLERTKGSEQDLSLKIKEHQETMRQKEEAIQHQHAYEMAQKDNKIRELNQEIVLLQR